MVGKIEISYLKKKAYVNFKGGVQPGENQDLCAIFSFSIPSQHPLRYFAEINISLKLSWRSVFRERVIDCHPFHGVGLNRRNT
jgi:hypothetical protein